MELLRIPNMNQPNKFLSLLLLCLLTLLTQGLSPAYAQEEEPNAPGIVLSAEAGFDGYFKTQFWLPVQVRVANNGPAVEGEIRLVTGSATSNNRLVYNAPISLPTQSNKRLSLFVGIANAGTRVLTVQLLDNNGTVIAQTDTNNLRLQDSDGLLYGVISSDPGKLDFLENVTGSHIDAAVAFLDIEDLPTVAPAWNSLDVLLFNDVDTGELTPAQLSVLQGWVGTGGQLIISGGPGWQKTAAAFTNMLPVTLTGSESADDLPALSAAMGFPFRDPGPYLLAASSLSNGELLYHQDGLPLLARQDWGRGAIYFLALDPKLAPLLDWDGREVLFDTIVGEAPQWPSWSLGVQSSYQAGEAVASLPSLALPSAAQLIIFLIVYVLVIGPVNYFFLKRMGRKELAWLTIPGLVVLFTLTAYVVGFQLKGNETIINQLNVTYGQVDSDQMRVHSLVGLYSPRRSRYDLILPSDTAARPFRRDFGAIGGGGNLEAVTRSNDLVMDDVLVDVSDVESFVADSYRPSPSVSGQADVNLNGNVVELNITVRNNGSTDLENATVLVGSLVFKLGDLPSGTSATDRFTISRTSLAGGSAVSAFGPSGRSGYPLTEHANTILGTSDYYNDPVAYPRWQLLEALDGRYYSSSPTTNRVPDNVATIIAWSDESQLDISLDGSEFEALSTTLYFIEIPLQRNLTSGSGVQVPAALLNWEARSIGGGVYEPTITNLYLSNDAWIEFEYTPWQEFSQIEVTGLAIRLLASDSSNSGPVPTIRLWDWQSEAFVDVEDVNWGSTAVADFYPFIGPDKAVRLYIRGTSSFGANISEIYPVITGNLE